MVIICFQAELVLSYQLAACIMNATEDWRCGYEKATSPFYKLQIWACFGMTRVDTKFEQG